MFSFSRPDATQTGSGGMRSASCGDDASDEYMFNALPENSISIKVGKKNTSAKYFVKNSEKIKSILSNLN